MSPVLYFHLYNQAILESNHPHFLFSKGQKKVPFRQLFSQELPVYGTESCVSASLNITVLIFLIPVSIIIYPSYLHNLHFLQPPFSFISQTSFIITILTVLILTLCLITKNLQTDLYDYQNLIFERNFLTFLFHDNQTARKNHNVFSREHQVILIK